MSVHLRPFTASDADYEAVVKIGNRLFPDYVDTVEEYKFSDSNKDPKIKHGRILAELDGEIIGFARYSQDISAYHPQEFSVNVNVLSEYQSQGIGKQLYDQLLETLTSFEPILLRTNAREDYTRSLRFLEDRGFVEKMREWESRFDPQSFDPTPFLPKDAQVRESGIEIQSIATLAQTDPEWKRKLYELDWEITLDIPTTATPTKPSFEHFEKTTLGDPCFLPEAWFIALENGEWVGESALWKAQGEPSLYVGATGVRRPWRRRGIATALKLAAAQYAKESGCPCVKTWNEQNNEGMLAINVAMGFVRMPAWIVYEKKV